MRACLFCRVDDLASRCVRSAIGDVFGQRPVEEDRLLLDNGDLAAQARLRHLCDILPVDPNGAGVDVVQPLDELDEGRLA